HRRPGAYFRQPDADALQHAGDARPVFRPGPLSRLDGPALALVGWNSRGRSPRNTLRTGRKCMLKRLMIAIAALGIAVSATAAYAQEKFKVGFVAIGPKNDGGWTQGHWTGVQALEKELGDKIEVTFLENVGEGPDAERAIEGLVQAGNKLIFTTSFGYME